MELLLGKAVKINNFADHTFVHCFTNNQYFDCWGGHTGPDERTICSGYGSYNVANCYRMPMFGHNDTAGVLYGADGVCHQSANRFLVTAKTVLNLRVRGYWLSSLAYGVYGITAPFFFAFIYPKCLKENLISSAPRAQGAMSVEAGPNAKDPVFEALQAYYSKVPELICNIGISTDSKDISEIDRKISLGEQDVLIASSFPNLNLDPEAAKDIKIIHKECLKERNAIFGEEQRWNRLADKINRMMNDVQKELADALDRETYVTLSGGIEPGDTVNIVDKKQKPKRPNVGQELK
jgi:hypothetical protein